MYQKFRDYLYYLLPAAFKRTRKEMNQWYIFFKVLGDEYDRVKMELEDALDQTSIVTCKDFMLPYFGQDRDMYQYPDEPSDTYRSRIALHDEVEALGGTKEAILLAARSLGYGKAEHVWLPDLGYKDKWSQFLLRVTVEDEKEHPAGFETLKNEVRKAKDSTSLDNYCFCNELSGNVYVGAELSVKNYVTIGDDAQI